VTKVTSHPPIALRMIPLAGKRVGDSLSKPASLFDLFRQHTGRLIDKWDHYLPIYERHFGRFRGEPIRLLEIGVQHGGSLQLWKEYFGASASIVGVDIDPRCQCLVEEGIDIEIGDQADPEFLHRLTSTYPDFEIVIDDGSHVSSDQLASFKALWPHVRSGGIYLVEDCACAYSPKFGGGLRSPASFIEFAKGTVDEIHAFSLGEQGLSLATRMTSELAALTFYDSVAVFEKGRRMPPRRITSGALSFRMPPDDEAAVLRAHVGYRGEAGKT
jgi:hypothetical protein